MASGFESNLYQVFWRKKSYSMQQDSSHQKWKYMFDFWLDSVQNRRIFFFSATLPSQKIVKEIAYILTSFQTPFKSAIFYFV